MYNERGWTEAVACVVYICTDLWIGGIWCEHFPLHNEAILWKPYLDLINCLLLHPSPHPLYSGGRLLDCRGQHSTRETEPVGEKRFIAGISLYDWGGWLGNMESVGQEVRKSRQVGTLGQRSQLLFTGGISSGLPQSYSSGLATNQMPAQIISDNLPYIKSTNYGF